MPRLLTAKQMSTMPPRIVYSPFNMKEPIDGLLRVLVGADGCNLIGEPLRLQYIDVAPCFGIPTALENPASKLKVDQHENDELFVLWEKEDLFLIICELTECARFAIHNIPVT